MGYELRTVQRSILPQSSSSPPPPTAPLYAFACFLAALATKNLRCFLSSMMLKRSKSVASFFALAACLDLAHELFAHFSATSDLSKTFLTVEVPAPRGRPGTTKGVRVV